MKSILIAAAMATLLPAQVVTWNKEDEYFIQKSTTGFAAKLSKQMVIVGRLGLPDTRPAAVISKEGHLLAPFLPSIDGEDAPYLLYQSDGSRIELTTIAENAKRFVSLLKIKEPAADLLPVRVAKVVDHTVIVPTAAPIASLGEPPSLYVDHLEYALPEDAKAMRLDGVFHPRGAPVFDLTGALIGITLEARQTNTPALMIPWLIADLPELNDILPDETVSNLEGLPLAPEASKEEARELSVSPITRARERYIQRSHPSPLPCVLVSNEGAQATHSVIGTIIRSEGLILTKASDLGPSLIVRYYGKNYPAVLLSTDEKTDLALVGIKQSGMPVVRWSDELPATGSVVASPVLLQESTDEMVAEATSYVGTFSHVLGKQIPSVHATSQVTSLGLTAEQLDSGLKVVAIKPDTPAFESGISPGDVIIKLNDRPIKTRAELTTFLDRCEVGDKITTEVERSGTSKTHEIELISPLMIPPPTGVNPARRIPMIPSIRRTPFPDVIVHTTPLNAWDCGSPIFDLDGRALGLNIAAISPARTIALRPKEIRAALDRLLANTRAF